MTEIKDEATRQRLQFLPYDLKFREPSTEDIQFVANFAKKTGDFSQLSATDIKVIALTLRLEKETNGDKNIKCHPEMTQIVSKTKDSLDEPLAGFYGFNKKNRQNYAKPQSNDKPDEKGDQVEDENIVADNNTDNEDVIDSEEDEEVDLSKSGDEEEDNSEEGWITPHNLEDIRKQMMGIKVEDEVEEQISVGCLTGDYAMQNVLLQMGLKVINIRDGLCIRQTKQYVLRCFACFKITNKSDDQFCHNCGNFKTLKRVALTLKDDGTKEVFINFKKPINIRGTKYSLPAPKSGKHANNPILVADQPIPQQRKSKFAVQEKKNLNSDKILNDPDYVNRINPFAINDVYSRGSKINTVFRRRVNPNETRKPTGNRKKKKNHI